MHVPSASALWRRALAAAATISLLFGLLTGIASAQESYTLRYLVVFGGSYTLDGSYTLGGDYTLNHEYALSLVAAAGGTVQSDLSRQIGVMIVDSSNALFAEVMSGYTLVEAVGTDGSFQGVPTHAEMAEAGPPGQGTDRPQGHGDPLESQQWNMELIRAAQAHADRQAGWSAVDVGILDTGIDATHLDFRALDGTSNVDCARGRDFTGDGLPADPGVGIPNPCVDNNFHGTHVAGIVAARANGYGVVGVAPNVTLVPVKVCDLDGHCYFSDVVDGLTYAGDAQLDVINMSFFVDDDTFQESTRLKCDSDPTQRAFKEAVQRAVTYVRKQGGLPVAALGNANDDLTEPPDDCEDVPAESEGVVGVVALGKDGRRASYSNTGVGAADVSAPGGNANNCLTGVLSTIPGAVGHGCFAGTSMASPHAAGVAALIVSQYGKLDTDADVKLAVGRLEDQLLATTIDIGAAGYDGCYGHGRIDAPRAVARDTSTASDPSVPACP